MVNPLKTQYAVIQTGTRTWHIASLAFGRNSDAPVYTVLQIAKYKSEAEAIKVVTAKNEAYAVLPFKVEC